MNREQTRNAEDGTRNKTDRLRALNVPQRVEVELGADGLPIGMRDAGCDMNRSVEAVGEVWRIDDEWWRMPIRRRYVEAILEGGKRVVLFEDLTTGAWWMQKPA
jgi:hypothetical protein